MGEVRIGYLYGLSAYLCWGFFPFYFKLLRPTGAVDILAHRVVWSAVFLALLLTALRGWPALRRRFGAAGAARRRLVGGVLLASVLIAVNWGTYIYSVNADRVVEAALGYFITPLVIVGLGVVVQHERLRAAQWTAIGIGAAAVAVLTANYGHLPYIALTLAASFGCYGLVKKRLALPAAEGLLVESATLAVPGLAWLVVVNARGTASPGQDSIGHLLLLALAGVITAGPLLLFAGAANRIPMIGLGILQYIAPVLQFAVGVLAFHEPMPPARIAGFALVWTALLIFSLDGVRQYRGRAGARAVPGAEPLPGAPAPAQSASDTGAGTDVPAETGCAPGQARPAPNPV